MKKEKEKEKGMYVQCIDNKWLEKYLTVGSKYKVASRYVDPNGNVMSYLVLDDSGAWNHYSPSLVEPCSLSTIDPIVEQVKEMFDKRSEVGIKKYGTTLHDNNTDDFYAHLQEELMDGILYLQKLKEMKSAFTSWVIAAFEAGYTDGFNDAQGDGIEYENAKDYFEQVIKNKI
jgi:hypothetical protein